MKCNSCEETISAKMKKAIDTNICPFCGDKILPEDLKEDISILDELLERLFDRYETFTRDFLREKYSIDKKGPPQKQHAAVPSDDEISDDMPLVEKLKNKRFRAEYMAQNQPTKQLSDLAKKIRTPADDEDSYSDKPDQYDADYLDPALEAYARPAAASDPEHLTQKEKRDLALLNKVMSGSQKKSHFIK